MTVQAIPSTAKTAYHEVQRQQIRPREQQERLRLPHAMPDASLLDIDEDFCSKCAEILTQGFIRPIYFAAIASDGMATSSSSETVSGAVQPVMKTDTAAGSSAMYLLPINVLLVGQNGQVAHGAINGSGLVSCSVSNECR
jgi:hypothetical protein